MQLGPTCEQLLQLAETAGARRVDACSNDCGEPSTTSPIVMAAETTQLSSESISHAARVTAPPLCCPRGANGRRPPQSNSAEKGMNG